MSKLITLARIAKHALIGRLHPGYCHVCEGVTIFHFYGWYAREHYRCRRCKSLPRMRALFKVLAEHFPNWRELTIHESSGSGPASEKLAAECAGYSASYYFEDVEPGGEKSGLRCENLERLTFPNESFDLVITQDVFEHVLRPAAAFAEVERVLRPGGGHVFTVPYWPDKHTRSRARPSESGIEHLAEPEYHGNPVDPAGSLVVTDWGDGFMDFIQEVSGLKTEKYSPHKLLLGLPGGKFRGYWQFLDVFISRKHFTRHSAGPRA